MGNPFSSILDVTKTSSLLESGHSFDFSYDDHYKSEQKSEKIHKEKKGGWGGKHDDDCD